METKVTNTIKVMNNNETRTSETNEVIIRKGKYGIKRTQMYEAMNKAFESKNKLGILTKLYKKYPDIFITTVRYMKSNQKEYIMNNFDLSFDNDIIMPGKYGITKNMVFNAIKMNINNKDFVKSIFKTFPTMANEVMRYFNKTYNNIILSYLYEDWNFKSEYMHINNEKLANLIKSDIRIVDNFNEIETKLAKEAVLDIGITKISKNNNMSVAKVYNILYGKNGKSLLSRAY